jgi:hypothetical protein
MEYNSILLLMSHISHTQFDEIYAGRTSISPMAIDNYAHAHLPAKVLSSVNITAIQAPLVMMAKNLAATANKFLNRNRPKSKQLLPLAHLSNYKYYRAAITKFPHQKQAHRVATFTKTMHELRLLNGNPIVNIPLMNTTGA